MTRSSTKTGAKTDGQDGGRSRTRAVTKRRAKAASPSAAGHGSTAATTAGKRQRGTRVSLIYECLRDEILRLDLKPGTPLDEVQLSKRFQLSRSPVREAIIRLASEGLVAIFPNRSSIVAPLELGLMPAFLDSLELMQRVTTRLAARNRSEEELVAVREAEAVFAEAVAKRQLLEMINTNYDYHIAIAQAGGNPYFTSLYSRLLNEGKRLLHLHFSFAAESRDRGVDTLVAEHAAITRAVEMQDEDLAEHLGYLHSVEFRRRCTRYMERNATQQVRLTQQPPAATIAKRR